MKINFRTVIFLITLFLVIFAVSVGFFMTGGPKYQRKVRLDGQRAFILNSLSSKMSCYYKGNKKLPEDLNELKAVKNNPSKCLDPEFKKLPDYNKISDEKFELCFTYSTSNFPDEDKKKYINHHYKYSAIKHKAGYHCAVYNKIKDKNKFKLEE